MKKGTIKVIKRKDVAEKTRVAANDVRTPAKTNQQIVEAVDGWVFDRQVNKDREKVFSNDKILSWELLPKTT